MEARRYAEDLAKGFLPSVGPLEHFIIPSPHPVVDRWESGFEKGDVISPFYDPMIAKIIVHGIDRRGAIDGLAQICSGTEVWPVRTNAAFLFRALEQPAFQA